MSAVEVTWPGGEHRFLLKIEQLRALQQKCDAGPQWILTRLGTGQWMVDDVIQTLRLGLEGAGMASSEARRLVSTHVEERPITLSVLAARLVLMAALYGEADDPVGEAQAGAETAKATDSREVNGGSRPSTEPEPS